MNSQKIDIRWHQRFNNFQKALTQLKKFIDKSDLSELEEQGLIKAFEYTYELAWNTLKDYLEFQGSVDIVGSRDTIREAFRNGLIKDGDIWMDMMKSRNQTSHGYNEKTAKEISTAIKKNYFVLFKELKQIMQSKLVKINL